MRVFAIYSSSTRKRHACAWLKYDSGNGACEIEISPDATEGDTPLLFQPYLGHGKHEIKGTIALKWALSRTVSSQRQNIEQVLSKAGLSEYYLPSLLTLTKGRSSDDDFFLEEVPEGSYRHAKIAPPLHAPQEIGIALGRARRAIGMSQMQLAEETGIQQAVISRIERGKGNPTISTLETLAQGVGRELKVSLD